MIRKAVETKEYLELAKKHDYFIWHFLRENQGNRTSLEIYSYFDEIEDKPHFLKQFLDMVPELPYYESLTKDSVDFLLEWGIPQHSFWRVGFGFQPLILGFKKGVKFIDTDDLKCYCSNSLIEMTFLLDPNLILPLGIEEENLK